MAAAGVDGMTHRAETVYTARSGSGRVGRPGPVPSPRVGMKIAKVILSVLWVLGILAFGALAFSSCSVDRRWHVGNECREHAPRMRDGSNPTLTPTLPLLLAPARTPAWPRECPCKNCGTLEETR